MSTFQDVAQAGALNLLRGCAGMQPGQRLLIVRETPGLGYFDDGLAPLIAHVADGMGLSVEMTGVPFMPEAPEINAALADRMGTSDVTLFLARLGDQLRFAATPMGRSVVCFAVSREMLGSAFATSDHATFAALKTLVNGHLAAARDVRVTCPRGTDFSGTPAMGDMADTSVLRFPVSVFAPVPGAQFSGRVALPGFLAGTGSRYYDDYLVRFDGPLTACFANGLLTGFDGLTADVARANRHYDTISTRYGIERDRVHSWHAGIHPGCGFGLDAQKHMELWSGVAFGNPRILHLHTCGADAPGEISLNVIDPTVTFDGVAIWENGVFHAERLDGGAAILAGSPGVAALFAAPDRRIGL